VRHIYEAPGATLTYNIPEDGDRDGPRNIGFIRIPDPADSLRRLHRTVGKRPLERPKRRLEDNTGMDLR
jgi:hypothetical protein